MITKKAQLTLSFPEKDVKYKKELRKRVNHHKCAVHIDYECLNQ